jgi:FkbM family methyltransferase
MFRRMLIGALRPLTSNTVYTVRHGLAKGLRRRGGLGFLRPIGPPSRETIFLERLDIDGHVVADIGGDEGVFTLFFARRVGPSGTVLTFEPNPRSHARIVENVALNGFTNVSVRRLALGRAPSQGVLVFPTDEAARGSLLEDIQAQILREQSVAAVEVEVDSLDHQIECGCPIPDLVKIDVEGLEYDVLEGMTVLVATRHPDLYIEIHGATTERKLVNATAVVQYLWRAGYRVHHVESGTVVEHQTQIASAIEGHLFCH